MEEEDLGEQMDDEVHVEPECDIATISFTECGECGECSDEEPGVDAPPPPPPPQQQQQQQQLGRPKRSVAGYDLGRWR